MRFIRLLLAKERAEAFEGDLREESTRGGYRREVASMIVHAAGPWLALAVAIGMVAGVLVQPAVGGHTAALLLYPSVVLVCIALFRWRPPQTYFLRFITTLTAFMTLFATHYVSSLAMSGNAARISVLGHTWRVAFFLAVACVASAAAALMTRERQRSSYAVPVALALLGYGAMFLVSHAPMMRPLPYPARLAILLSVPAIVLLAVAGFLRAQRIDSMMRRFAIVAGVNGVIAGLLILVPVLSYDAARARGEWAFWFQNGALLAEIVLMSAVIAALTRTRAEVAPRPPRSLDSRSG